MAKHYRHGSKHHPHHKRSSNRFRRHRHSNPLALGRTFSMRNIGNTLMPAVVGGAGAIGVDVALAYVPLPAMLATGWGRFAVQIAGALGLGWLASFVVSKQNALLVTGGALTVTAYSGLRQVLAPTLGTTVKGLSGLADFSDYKPAWPGEYAIGAGPGAYASQDRMMRMGAYIGSSHPEIISNRPGMGAYMNPAAFISPIRAKQMGAYMRSPLGGYISEDM